MKLTTDQARAVTSTTTMLVRMKQKMVGPMGHSSVRIRIRHHGYDAVPYHADFIFKLGGVCVCVLQVLLVNDSGRVGDDDKERTDKGKKNACRSHRSGSKI